MREPSRSPTAALSTTPSRSGRSPRRSLTMPDHVRLCQIMPDRALEVRVTHLAGWEWAESDTSYLCSATDRTAEHTRQTDKTQINITTRRWAPSEAWGSAHLKSSVRGERGCSPACQQGDGSNLIWPFVLHRPTGFRARRDADDQACIDSPWRCPNPGLLPFSPTEVGHQGPEHSRACRARAFLRCARPPAEARCISRGWKTYRWLHAMPCLHSRIGLARPA